jgi:Ca-activated chloride channel family protein
MFQYFNNILWLLALLPFLGLYAWYVYWKRSAIKRAGNPALVKAMMQGVSETRNLVKTGLVAMALILLAIAMMNYQKPVQQAGGGLKGIDVIIALDVSNSMLANDVSPNRLERARLLAAKLIDTLQGNRVGIIAFAGDAYLQLPLTTDLTAARLYLQSVSTTLVPVQGTNIHAALKLANESLDPAAKEYKAVLLVTDGEELDEKAMDEAKELKESGVVIIPVGIGTPNGATLPDENGGQRRDEKGEVVISKLNEKLLQELAAETNGTYRLMGETTETLNEIVTELKSMDQKPISNSRLVNYKSYSYWMIALAFILLLLEILVPARVKGKVAIAPKLKQVPAALTLLFIGLFVIQGSVVSQSARSLLNKANEAYRQGQYKEADQLYRSVLKTDPTNKVAKFNLGNIAYRLSQYDLAANHYNEVNGSKSVTKKETAAALNNKGLSYVNEKDLQKAIASFKESIRQDPYDEEVRNNLMKALQEQQKQNQQNQPDSTKQPPPKQKPENKMKKNDAEQKLAALRQEEKKIRDKMKQPASGEGSEKDW